MYLVFFHLCEVKALDLKLKTLKSPHPSPSWNLRGSPEDLSKSLVVQLRLEKSLWTELSKLEDSSRASQFLLSNLGDIQSAMSKFEVFKYGYQDVFQRDVEAFKYVENVQQQHRIFVSGVFTESRYLGHVYTWIHPSDSSVVFMIGIRKSILHLGSQFDKVPKMSLKILESVRIFAQKMEASSIVVLYPLRQMEKIIKSVGFQQVEVEDRHNAGNSKFGNKDIRIPTFIKSDLSESFL